jgi:tetratricopeptide (TPR) repeat protein
MKCALFRGTAFAFALGAALALSACANKAQKAQALVQSGEQKLAAQDYPGAFDDFDQAINLQPDLAEAYCGRGIAEVVNSNKDRQLADFTQAIELDPHYTKSYLGRAQVERDKGDLPSAIADYGKYLAANSGDAAAYFSRADAEGAVGDFDNAVADYSKVVDLKASNAPQAGLDCAIIKQLQGDFAAALAAYDQVLAAPSTAAPTADFLLARLNRHVLAQQLGRGPDDLAQAAASWKDGWEKTIAQYLTGGQNEADFLAAGAQGDSNHQCQADYFAGMKHLFDGDTAGARKLFLQSTIVDGATANEVLFAKAELAALGEPALK